MPRHALLGAVALPARRCGWGVTLLAVSDDDDPGARQMPVGARFSLEGESLSAIVLRTQPRHPDSTAPRTLRVPSPHACVMWACAWRWVRPLSSATGCGGGRRRLVSTRTAALTPRRGSGTLPIWCNRDCQRTGPL